MEFIPFTANDTDERSELLQTVKFRKGAAEAVREYVESYGQSFSARVRRGRTQALLKIGGTPLVVAKGSISVLGVDLSKRYY